MSFISEMTTANQITIIRIAIIPLFIVLANIFGQQEPTLSLKRYLPLSVFLFAGLLDILDGYLARKRKEVTRLGTILDPMADKLLTISALFMLCFNNHLSFFGKIPLWFIVTVILRETILITGTLIIFLMKSHVQIKPRMAGKLSTFILVLLIVSVLAGIPESITDAIVIPSTFFIILSLIMYTIDGVKQVGSVKKEADSAKNIL